MARFLPLDQAVAENLKHGDTAAFEGFTHLIPTAAAHEAIRQGFRDLTLVRMTPDLVYDQMIGMGMAKKAVFSYAGNPGVGLLRRFRDAVENGFPRPIEIEEHSHAAMANAWEAGAAGLPCAVFRGYRGAGLAEVNPNVRSLACPFTGEVLAAVPALRPDVTFIHAQKASRRGDVLVEVRWLVADQVTRDWRPLDSLAAGSIVAPVDRAATVQVRVIDLVGRVTTGSATAPAGTWSAP